MPYAQDVTLPLPRRGQKPLGFESVALIVTMGLSREAVSELTTMVKDVAQKKGYDDSAMLRTFKSRFGRAVRLNKQWAIEITRHLEKIAAEKASAARVVTT